MKISTLSTFKKNSFRGNYSPKYDNQLSITQAKIVHLFNYERTSVLVQNLSKALKNYQFQDFESFSKLPLEDKSYNKEA